MVRKTHQVMKNLAAVLTFVHFVPAMGLDVRAKVVAAGVAPSTNVAGERFLTSVNASVTSEVSSTNELTATHVTDKRSLHLLGDLVVFCTGIRDDYLGHDPGRLELQHFLSGELLSILWRCHSSQQMEIVTKAGLVHFRGEGDREGVARERLILWSDGRSL